MRLKPPSLRVISFVFVAFASLATVLGAWQDSSIYVQLEAKANSITVEPFESMSAAFSIPSARLKNGSCENEIHIFPKNSARVFYDLNREGDFFLSVIGEHMFESSATEKTMRSSSTLILASSEDCERNSQLILPFAGKLSVGSLRQQQRTFVNDISYVMEADVTLYAKSISNLFGIIPLTIWPFSPNAMYEFGTLSVPFGSEIVGARLENSGFVDWDGYIIASQVERDETMAFETEMRVYATSRADMLIFKPPFFESDDQLRIGTLREEEFETVSFSLLGRLVSDPNIRVLFTLLLILVSVAELGGVLRALRE